MADMETRRQQIRTEITKAAPVPGTPPPPVPGAPAPVTPITNKDGTVTIPSGPKKGTYEPQPDGTYKKIG
jgi:hypothetical protein